MAQMTYFADSYITARKAFIIAAQEAGASLSSYVHPHEKSPEGEDLAVDTAWLGPRDANTVLLCISGTHGPEGYCGSAAQLQSLNDGSLAALSEGVAVLMIHALNPFGFAYMTRYTENNVDLNRNWINFTSAPKTHELYKEIHSHLPPENQLTDALFSDALGALAGLLQKHDGFALENALSAGQYDHPTGIGYGGKKAEWSALVMRKILADISPKTRHIAYLDWHSLIRSGMDDMVYLCFNQPTDVLFNRTMSWWGAENVSMEKVDEKWSKGLGRRGGRPDRNGIMMWGVQKHVSPQMDVAGGVIEFTDELMDPLLQKAANLRAMLLSRYFVHTRDIDTKKGKVLFDESRELWCPTRKNWQEKSLVSAQRIFLKTLNGAAEWAAM
ncbi:MAG: DUF2817 domain-containing protein [Kordiimonadaceae bacterium]|nr:DUF2817 domain-containing protein [Kordiimonadaceae bacterium]